MERKRQEELAAEEQKREEERKIKEEEYRKREEKEDEYRRQSIHIRFVTIIKWVCMFLAAIIVFVIICFISFGLIYPVLDKCWMAVFGEGESGIKVCILGGIGVVIICCNFEGGVCEAAKEVEEYFEKDIISPMIRKHFEKKRSMKDESKID